MIGGVARIIQVEEGFEYKLNYTFFFTAGSIISEIH